MQAWNLEGYRASKKKTNIVCYSGGYCDTGGRWSWHSAWLAHRRHILQQGEDMFAEDTAKEGKLILFAIVPKFHSYGYKFV